MEVFDRVTVVTVTWHSAEVIRDFLTACPPQVRVIVVDNASPDGTAALARHARPDAAVLEAPRNLGFGAGCNLGLSRVATEFVLLANPDARISACAIRELVAAADAWPEARLVAPVLRDGSGERVRSWNVAQPRRGALPRNRDGEPLSEGPFCADYVSGACLLLRPADGLRFDEAFFLFYEDDDLCARAGGALVVPAAEVAHGGGRSSPPTSGTRWRKARCMAWSRLRFTALHGGGEDAARREGARRLLHHAGKAAGHALTFQVPKVLTDLAGVAGTAAWLAGRR